MTARRRLGLDNGGGLVTDYRYCSVRKYSPGDW